MKTDSAAQPKSGKGKIRRPRFWNGWTARAIEAHIGHLKAHPPCEFYSLKYPSGSAPKLYQLEAVMVRLNTSLMDACRRYDYRGVWCLFYENGKDSGLHFHVWFAEPPGVALEEAVRKNWLRHTGQANNIRKVFHTTGPKRDVEKMKSYLGKHYKNGYRTKMEQIQIANPAQRFKPYNIHGAKLLVMTMAKQTAGIPPILTPRSASGHDFTHDKVTISRVDCLCKHKASSVSRRASPDERVQHLHHREQDGMEHRDEPSPCPSAPATAGHLTAGVRIVSNCGANGIVPPAHREANSHFEKIISAGYTCAAVLDVDPLRPDTMIEWLFKVPVGGMIEFERLAGSYRHVRLFRPSWEISTLRLHSAVPA